MARRISTDGIVKRCPKCETEKPLTEFNKARRAPDGYQGYCRDCQRGYAAKYNPDYRQREETRERERSRQRPYDPRMAAWRAQWQKENRERAREYYRRYRNRHPERERQRIRERNRFRRGVEDQRWCEDVLLRDPCCYCGGPAEHIDHIIPDLSQGTWENLTPACGPCNSSKSDRPLLLWLATRVRIP